MQARPAASAAGCHELLRLTSGSLLEVRACSRWLWRQQDLRWLRCRHGCNACQEALITHHCCCWSAECLGLSSTRLLYHILSCDGRSRSQQPLQVVPAGKARLKLLAHDKSTPTSRPA